MMYKWEVPAMAAVIYARYSSDNQREESIEGQIRECTAYAEKNGITIVNPSFYTFFLQRYDEYFDFARKNGG